MDIVNSLTTTDDIVIALAVSLVSVIAKTLFKPSRVELKLLSQFATLLVLAIFKLSKNHMHIQEHLNRLRVELYMIRRKLSGGKINVG